MDLNDIALSSVKYQFQAFTIDAGGSTFDVPISQIMSVKIEKNFDMDTYPFFYIGVNLPGWFYADVVKNYDNIHITLDLHCITYRQEFNESMVGASSKSELKGKFLADVAVDTPILMEDNQKKFEESAESYKKSYAFNEYYYTEFTIQNEASYKAKSKVINAVLTSTNMTSNIAYICSACGITNILMSPLSNRQTYSEFKIPPINAVDQIKNWIVNYKLHNAGTSLFFDLDRAYILSKEMNCTAWRLNEYKTVHVMTLSQFSDSLSMGSGYYANSKEKYHLIEIPPNSIQTSSITTLPSIVQSDNMKQTITFYTNDCIMEALTPNKLFIVDIQSESAKTKINGKYRIMRYSVEMEPGGDFLNAKFNVTLGKNT